MNTDGNTDAINRHLADREAYDEHQELLQELQDLRDEVDTLIAKLAEVTAENRELALQIISSDGQAIDAYAAQKEAEAMLPRAYRAGVEAGDVVAIEQAISAVMEEGGDVRSAAQYVVTCILALPTPTIEQLKDMMKD